MPEERNPLRAALQARDTEMLSRSLATDVVVHSPILDVPFEGREEVTALFAALYEVLGEMTYPFDLPGDPAVFMWRTDVGGEPLEGVDVYRLNDRGEVHELTVLMRPLRGVAAFIDATGPTLAKRLGGSPLAVRLGNAPVGMAMRTMSRFAPRTLGMRRGRRAGG
jgi:SnoaL-like domain